MLLLDTDVMVDVLRGFPPALAWLASLVDEPIVLPGFVVMELIQGCRNRREQRKLERVLVPYTVVWPARETCDTALHVFGRFHLSHNIGVIDALIGQLAVDLDTPLWTFNQRYYVAIPNLRTMQPYAKTAG